jgi:hypothetical protein
MSSLRGLWMGDRRVDLGLAPQAVQRPPLSGAFKVTIDYGYGAYVAT